MSKNYIKMMSRQTHRCSLSNEKTFNDWVDYVAWIGVMLWVLRWPILFIIYLLTELFK
mgnify:CR=1 FL=1